MFSAKWLRVTALILLAIGVSEGLAAAKPPPSTHPAATHPSPFNQDTERQLYADLQSGDAARVAAACDAVRAALLKKRHDINAAAALDHMLIHHLYQQVVANTDPEVQIAHADSFGWLSQILKTRAKALLALKQPQEALAAAKAYYNMAALSQTKDAIGVVCVCLAAAHPEDKDIVHRFKQEQVNGSTGSPQAGSTPSASSGQAGSPQAGATTQTAAATQQSASGATRPADSGNATGGTPALPSSVLASIQIDPKPYGEAITDIVPELPRDYQIKGNLLLLAGRAKEAEGVFREEYDLAEGGQIRKATEDVARAIRDEAGCVGPANAYIMSLREKAGP